MKVQHFVSNSGKDLIRSFIRALPKNSQRNCLENIKLLEEYGFELSSKYIKKIDNKPKLWELRVGSSTQIRFIFALRDKYAILLHGFVKKTQKIQKKELKTAILREKQL